MFYFIKNSYKEIEIKKCFMVILIRDAVKHNKNKINKEYFKLKERKNIIKRY